MNLKTCTRAEWDGRYQPYGSHGFDPATPWHVATWRERLGIIFFHGVMWGIVFPAMLIGGLALIGGTLDGIAMSSAAHDSCLKHATNGYEIRACH